MIGFILGWKKKDYGPVDHYFALKVRGRGRKNGRGKGEGVIGFSCQGLGWKKKDYAPMDHCFAFRGGGGYKEKGNGGVIGFSCTALDCAVHLYSIILTDLAIYDVMKEGEYGGCFVF